MALSLNVSDPAVLVGLPDMVSGLLCSQQRLLLIDAPLHNTFLELWTTVHFLIPGLSRPYLHVPLKAPTEENQDYYHKVVIRLHRVRAALTPGEQGTAVVCGMSFPEGNHGVSCPR